MSRSQVHPRLRPRDVLNRPSGNPAEGRYLNALAEASNRTSVCRAHPPRKLAGHCHCVCADAGTRPKQDQFPNFGRVRAHAASRGRSVFRGTIKSVERSIPCLREHYVSSLPTAVALEGRSELARLWDRWLRLVSYRQSMCPCRRSGPRLPLCRDLTTLAHARQAGRRPVLQTVRL
jgi:hypothetical protein